MEVRPAHSIRLDSAPLLLNTGPRVACCRRSALPHPHAHQLGTISARGSHCGRTWMVTDEHSLHPLIRTGT
jgi:hypothetical protein